MFELKCFLECYPSHFHISIQDEFTGYKYPKRKALTYR